MRTAEHSFINQTHTEKTTHQILCKFSPEVTWVWGACTYSPFILYFTVLYYDIRWRSLNRSMWYFGTPSINFFMFLYVRVFFRCPELFFLIEIMNWCWSINDLNYVLTVFSCKTRFILHHHNKKTQCKFTKKKKKLRGFWLVVGHVWELY